MGIVATIGGTDRTRAMDLTTIEILNTIAANSDSMDFAVTTTGDWRPKAANEIIVSTSSDGLRHFGGMLIDVTEEQVNPSQFRYRCSCKDYTHLFDRLMVAKIYPSQNADVTLMDIVNNYSSGFSTTGITSPAPAIAAQRFDYVYPSDCQRSIADQLQWISFIDYSKVVWLVPSAAFAAPVAAVNLDTDVSVLGSVRLRESASQLKNRIVVDGYQKAGTVNNQNTFAGTGNQRFFLLGVPPAGVSTTGVSSTAVNATLNGVPLALATDFISSVPSTSSVAGTSGTLYVCQDNMGVRMDYTPTSTETLVVTYQYMVAGGIQQDDAASQTEVASREGGDGVHMFRVQDPQLQIYSNSDDLAISVGQRLAARYGQPKVQGEATSFTQGWRAGQTFSLSTTKRWAGGFTKTMYVHQVKKRWVNHPSTGGSPTFRYELAFGETWLPL